MAKPVGASLCGRPLVIGVDCSTTACKAIAWDLSGTRLAAVSIAHQRETFVPVDESGEALRNAILWMDERCRALLPRLVQQLGAGRFHHLTGKPLSGNLSAGKILWLSRNEPDVFRSARWYLDTHAFLVQRLTGRMATGWGSADPTGLFDMHHNRWAGSGSLDRADPEH